MESSARPLAAELAPAERERARRGSVALDQWRGLALLCVLISHGFFFTNRVNGIGRVGVNLFFFISGILVFRSLEKLRPAGFRVRSGAFWKHRLRRLYPALLGYTVAVLPLVASMQHRPGLLPGSDLPSFLRAWPRALLYLVDYPPPAPISLGHLWSVACEMQFYLLAPLLYAAGLAFGRGRVLLECSPRCLHGDGRRRYPPSGYAIRIPFCGLADDARFLR